MTKRKIIEIDEEKCDGCGLCVPSCAEGAIQIIDGKARLVSEVYCDGLGACLGTCPQGAITITEREAEPFDEDAARRHVANVQPGRGGAGPSQGCPGSAVRDLRPGVLSAKGRETTASVKGDSLDGPCSALGNWPVQLRLVPPDAPFLRNSDLLLVADCVPFACADFHRRVLKGRPVVVGCPKLDDAQWYVRKLADVLTRSSVRSLTVVHMEVPCCTGLVRIAEAAVAMSGSSVPLVDVTITIQGEIVEPSPQSSEGG